MKIKVLFLLLSLGIVSASELTAPSFQLMNQNGENIELDSFKGKKVILEWTNHDCPFVQRHYETSNMQNLQEKYTEEGVIWLSIISSAEGKQGYVSPDEAIELTNARSAKPSHVLLTPQAKLEKCIRQKQHLICTSLMKIRNCSTKERLTIWAELERSLIQTYQKQRIMLLQQ